MLKTLKCNSSDFIDQERLSMNDIYEDKWKYASFVYKIIPLFSEK